MMWPAPAARNQGFPPVADAGAVWVAQLAALCVVVDSAGAGAELRADHVGGEDLAVRVDVLGAPARHGDDRAGAGVNACGTAARPVPASPDRQPGAPDGPDLEQGDGALAIEPSLVSYDAGRKLWDYQLLRGGDEVLYVGDFHDLVLHATDEDLAELRARGVATDRWQPSG